VHAAVHQCLVQQGDARHFDLYVTPPRRLLPTKSTLTEEGLVPAAKIFVSWKAGSTPDKKAPVGSYLEPRLFAVSQATANASSFPSAQPVVGSATSASNKSQDGTADGDGKTEKKGRNEEDLLKRMMGGRGGLGGGGGGGGAKDGGAKDKDAKPGSGKPKWFK
jgi:hypothetical protein